MPLLEQVLEKYPTDVKLIFKNFPLRNHKHAKPAAIAAMAADRQGRFWDYHDEIFLVYNQLNEAKFEEIAQKLNLDMERFRRDQKDPGIIQAIGNDVQEGFKAGVRGTPTIFVNGRRLKQRSMQGFQTIIDSELAKLRQKGK
jgi:protein-disulfide isomerase